MNNAAIAKLIREAAKALFAQQKYSSGYLIVGDSDIAEASLVTHVAAKFIKDKHVVWAESPFKHHLSNRTRHVDLYVDLEPLKSEFPNILIVEAKRITPGEESKNLKKIVGDFERLRKWPSRKGSSLFFRPGLEVESVRGALAVIVANEDSTALANTTFSYWWKNLNAPPRGYPKAMIARLGSNLKKAAIRDVIYSRYNDGGIRFAALYAIFDL